MNTVYMSIVMPHKEGDTWEAIITRNSEVIGRIVDKSVARCTKYAARQIRKHYKEDQ